MRYIDLLWPARWPQYRVSQGNYYITQAEGFLQKGEAAAALYRLRSGLSKSPANANGRTTLAGLYLAYRRPDLAKQLLLDGLKYLPGDPAYLQSTLSFLFELQEDPLLLDVTGRLLAAPASVNPACRPIAAIYAATAAFYRGNYDLAEDLIPQHHLGDSADGATLLARLEWERGYPELALLRLKEYLSQHPGQDSARALLASYYRSLGRTGE